MTFLTEAQVADRLARQRRIYGCTIEEMRQQFSRALRMDGPKMLVMSQLSDSQVQIEMGFHEDARQTINRAKWALMEFLEEPVAPRM